MLAKRFALGFGLAVILPILVYYGVCTFSPPAKWEDYVSKKKYIDQKDIVEQAFFSKGVQDEKAGSQEQRLAFRSAYEKLIRDGRDAEQDKLDNARKDHEKRFQRHMFMVAAPIGFTAIVLGIFIALSPVGTGLMFGGIITFLEGTLCQWSSLEDWMKFVLLLLTFVTLIIIGYKKLSDKPSGSKPSANKGSGAEPLPDNTALGQA